MKVNTAYRQGLKQKTIDMAMTMFHEYGIKSVKMDDIANSLSISKRTLYELYANKEDLVYEVVVQYEQYAHERMKQLDKPGVDVMDIICEFIRLQIERAKDISPIFYEDLNKYPACLDFIRQRHDESRKESKEFFERGVAEGYFIQDINYDIINDISEFAKNGLMSTSSYKKYNMKELFLSFVMIFIRGICTEKGINTLDVFLRKLD